MAEKCHSMEELLRDLTDKVRDEDREAIVRLLEKVNRPCILFQPADACLGYGRARWLHRA